VYRSGALDQYGASLTHAGWTDNGSGVYTKQYDEIYLLPTTGHLLLIIAPDVNTPPSNTPTFYLCRAFAVGADAFVQLRKRDTAPDCALLAEQLSGMGTPWTVHPHSPDGQPTGVCLLSRADTQALVDDDGAQRLGMQACALMREAGWTG
jgi:hypothetical protein